MIPKQVPSSNDQRRSRGPRGLLCIVAFAMGVLLTGGLISWVARFWVALSWWQVFRRSVSVATVLMLWVFIRYIHHQPLRSFGLTAFRQGKWQAIRGAILGCGAVFLVGVAYLATGVCYISIHPDSARLWRTVLTFVPSVVVIGLLEELTFRGYLLHQLLRYSTPHAVVGSSAAYALVHLRTRIMWPESGFELLGLFLLGVILSLSVLRTRSLYLAIGLHGALAYWARVNKLLIAFTDPSLQWLVGSSRLVNGIVGWLVLGGLGWLIVRYARPATIGGDG